MTKFYSSVFEMGEEIFQMKLSAYRKFNDGKDMPEDVQRAERHEMAVRGMIDPCFVMMEGLE